MIGCSKRVKAEGDTLNLDGLTDLPINVKHQIQEHLSIEEAAKMSVLSRPWRHVWASIPKLLFSDQFCNSKPSHKLIDVINTILSQHLGAIKIFLVNISSIPSSKHSVIDQWMILLSKNGLKDLTLLNLNNARYKLPAFMYGVQLERLDLDTCIFRPPCNFKGFPKLKLLSLRRVILQLDTASSFLWMPNVRVLNFAACRPLHHLKMYAPKLWRLSFYITGTWTLNLGHFKGCRNLKIVSLASKINQDKVMKLTNLLSRCPKVSNLYLYGCYLKSLASEVERFPTHLHSLRVLCSNNFDFDDNDQIFCILRMLTNNPNLKDLLLESVSKMKGGVEDNVNRPAYSTQILNKLHKLEIQAFHGLRAEFLFVRFIFASAPLLLKAILCVDESVHESKYLKISEELMGLPKASPKLEIICEPPKQAK